MFTDSAFEMIQAEGRHRDHAIVEQVFADWNDGPLAHLPSGHFPANAAWLTLAAITCNLTRAAGTLAGPFHAKARGATIRRQLINVAARIARHRADRGKAWRTLEAPLALAETLADLRETDIAVIDCLTLWLSNSMFDEAGHTARLAGLVPALAACRAPHSPRNCRTPSIRIKSPYMPGWQYDSPPPLVLTGSAPFGAIRPSDTKAPPSPFRQKPRSSRNRIVLMVKAS